MGNQLTNRYLRREKQTKVASAGCHRGLSYGASGGDPPLLRPHWNDMTPTARRPYPKTKKRKGRPLLAPPFATLENEQKHRSASKRSFFFTRPELAEKPKTKKKYLSPFLPKKKKKKKFPPFFQKKKKKKKKKS